MTSHLPRTHIPFHELKWSLHNPRHVAPFTPARWTNDHFGGVMAFTSVDHIREYKVHHVNRADWQTCADRAAAEATFLPGSEVHGYYTDPNELHYVLSDGSWDVRWRYASYLLAQLPKPRDLYTRPRFVNGRGVFDRYDEIPF